MVHLLDQVHGLRHRGDRVAVVGVERDANFQLRGHLGCLANGGDGCRGHPVDSQLDHRAPVFKGLDHIRSDRLVPDVEIDAQHLEADLVVGGDLRGELCPAVLDLVDAVVAEFLEGLGLVFMRAEIDAVLEGVEGGLEGGRLCVFCSCDAGSRQQHCEE